MNKIIELFGKNTHQKSDWKNLVEKQKMPLYTKRCSKVRKDAPNISIGTCTVKYGKEDRPIIICPKRLLERNQIFIDCIDLLEKHHPSNEIHILPEVNIPGGYVDYVLASVKQKNL